MFCSGSYVDLFELKPSHGSSSAFCFSASTVMNRVKAII
jgi:hypothetical protein